MRRKSAKKSSGVLGKTLRLADFESLATELKGWRTSELQDIEKSKGSGLVLGFVKGLRLSAGLIYVLRKRLSGNQLEVHWGHLLDSYHDSCSPECDVIIHKKGFYEEWNGHDDRVMDFKFIECDNALAVISCKSYAKKVDADYPKKLSPYVTQVILFAECCPPEQYDKLCLQAKKAGYQGFWMSEPASRSIARTIGMNSSTRFHRSPRLPVHERNDTNDEKATDCDYRQVL